MHRGIRFTQLNQSDAAFYRGRILHGVALPNLSLLGLGVVHWLVLAAISRGEPQGWNLIILFVYIPIIVGVSTVLSCWILWTRAPSARHQFVLGLRVPIFAYVVIVIFTIYLYWETRR